MPDQDEMNRVQKKETLGDLISEAANIHPLKEILDDCLNQVTDGKGADRHGQGKGFLDQPWKSLADVHGVGFLTGQAAKKLEEAQGFDNEDIDRWDREMYGVIVYAAMAILYRRKYEEY